MLTARNVVPSGRPRCCSVWLVPPLGPVRDVLSRKSRVMAMPMEAKAREVRSQARNVRSASQCVSDEPASSTGKSLSPSARWSLATLPLFSSSTDRKYRENFRHLLSSSFALRLDAVALPPVRLAAPVGCSCWLAALPGALGFRCRGSVSCCRVW